MHHSSFVLIHFTLNTKALGRFTGSFVHIRKLTEQGNLWRQWGKINDRTPQTGLQPAELAALEIELTVLFLVKESPVEGKQDLW